MNDEISNADDENNRDEYCVVKFIRAGPIA